MSSLWLVPADGEPIEIKKHHAVVGRDPKGDVVVNDGSISRRHAVIEHESGTWVVSDQKSANGTWIDGQRVIKALLKTWQQLRFGAVSFEVSLERPTARPATKRSVAASEPPRRPPAPPPSPSESTRPAPPRAAPRSVGAMSPEEAAELLGVLPGAPDYEIRRKYQKIYNDFQIRLTNAPTPSLKRMYQKNLQDLKAAAEVLSPGILSDGS